LFEKILEVCRQRGWLKAHGKQRTDSTHIVAAVHRLNRVELVGEAIFHALDVLAQVDRAWLQAHIPADWIDRYRQRRSGFRLPKSEKAQLELALTIGQDGLQLMTTIYDPAAPEYLRRLPVKIEIRSPEFIGLKSPLISGRFVRCSARA